MPHQDARSSKKANSNYRKYYEDQTGEPIPEGYEIHHIDHDRKNNDIDNLVALPRKVHRRYHFYKYAYDQVVKNNVIEEISPMDITLGSGMFHLYRTNLEEISSYISMCEEVSEYILRRQIQIHGDLSGAMNYSYESMLKRII